MQKFTEVETKRLRLRDITMIDLDAFTAYRNDSNIARYQSWTDYDHAKAETFFHKQQALTFGEIDSWYQIAIADKQSDELLGDCVIHFIDSQQVEIGFTLAAQHHGEGIATEAIQALLSLIFNQLGKHRVIAVTDVMNSGSVKLLERLGFRREGEFVENVFFKGAWGSEFMYAMLRREFVSR